MKCLLFKANIYVPLVLGFFCLSSKIILTFGDFLMPIYVLLVWGFFNLDFYEARFKALFDEIWFFAFSSLIWPLEWLSEPDLDLLS